MHWTLARSGGELIPRGWKSDAAARAVCVGGRAEGSPRRVVGLLARAIPGHRVAPSGLGALAIGGRLLAPSGLGALAIDGGLLASAEGAAAVQRGVVPSELRLPSAKRGLRSVELLALVIAQMRPPVPRGRVDPTFAFVHLALAHVLLALAFVRDTVALIGRRVAEIRGAIALLGGRVTTSRVSIAITPAQFAALLTLGGAALVLGVQQLEVGRLLVVLQRLAVHLGCLPMEVAQDRVGGFGHETLAALGRLTLAERPLTRLIAQSLGAPSPLTML
jgi:hypothetical protein